MIYAFTRRILLLLCLVVMMPFAAVAQESAAEISERSEDDRGFITNFLEQRLSGAGRSIQIDGFQGALSSRATFTRMTIADDDGVWLTLENGAMQWTRSALFNRRVEISELVADRVIVARLPQGGEVDDQAPQPEAQPFSLPQLPVAVNIERIAINRVELAEGIIGQEAVFGIDGAMNLSGGEGETNLAVNRVDGPRGVFRLDAAFSNTTRLLRFNLDLDEDQGGLFTNIVGMNDQPAVKGSIRGEGPLSEFTAQINLETNGTPRVAGAVALRATEVDGTPGMAFGVDVEGDVSSFSAPDNQVFFAGNSEIRLQGWRGQDGRIVVPKMLIATGALNLQGSFATTAQSAPESAALTLLMGEDAGATQLPVGVPWADRPTTVRSANLRLDYDSAQGAGWQLTGRIGDLMRDDISLSEMRVDGRGRVLLTPDRALEDVRGWVAFGIDDLLPADTAVAQAIGDVLNGGLNFSFKPGNALEFWGMNINGAEYGFTGDMAVSGLSTGITLSGDIALEHRNLSRLSQVAQRELGGNARADFKGSYTLLSHAFDVDTLVIGNDIRVGQENADRMLAGQSRIELSARRDTTGISLRRMMVNAQNLTAEAEGFLSSTQSDVTAKVSMPDLSVADPRLAGAVQTDAHVTGPDGARKLLLNGHAQNLVTQMADIDGALRGETDLIIEVQQQGEVFNLQRFDLRNPQLTATGDGNFGADALDARLDVAMPDLSVLGRGFSGGFSAQATATRQDGGRQIEVTGRGDELRFGREDVDGALTGITELRLSANERNGELTVSDFRLNNQQMNATAQGTVGDAGTDFRGDVNIQSLASFGRGWRGALQAQGSFSDDGTGARRLSVTGTGNDLSFGQAQMDGALSGPTRLTVEGVERDGTFSIQTAQIENARLNVSARGQVGTTHGATDLTANLRADDLRFLGQGFRGSLTAEGRVVDQEGGGRQITASGAANGLAVGDPRADAVLAGNTNFQANVAQRPDGSVTVSSLNAGNTHFSITGDGNPAEGMRLDARLANLALLVPNFPGPATVQGSVQNVGARYVIDLNATAPGDVRANIAGSAAADFSNMDIRVDGNANSAVANSILRTRSVEGPISFDVRINGAPSLEAVSGRVALTNARLAEPRFGLTVSSLNAIADLNAGRVNLDVNGNVDSGGTISVTGPVTLTGNRPMDLTVLLNQVVLRDPNLYETRASGTIRVTGDSAQGPLIAGRVDVGQTEIRIPSTGLGGARAIPDIIHRSERPPQRQTRAKAGLLEFPSEASRKAGMSAPPATPGAVPARFDLTISAPDQLFIRGRGVDAEMGGEMRLTGNARQPIPIGQFELIRGRVDLLGKRFNLSEGLIGLQGSLIPVIRLVAQTEQDGTITRIIIDGEARDPDITFESVPDMPQEEVLSQLLFGRGLENISALQAAQLASAVATLAGRGGDGIVGRLREATGLDDLDLTTDDEGNVSVRAGRYLTDNLYSDVEVGDQGTTRINLNLDVSQTLTARGSVASDGDSSIGLFYERDY